MHFRSGRVELFCTYDATVKRRLIGLEFREPSFEHVRFNPQTSSIGPIILSEALLGVVLPDMFKGTRLRKRNCIGYLEE